MSKNNVRTLDDMNKFFESRGIKVTRDYERSAKRYHFKLSRDNCMKVFYFYYPTSDDREERYSQMTACCKAMLEEFEKFCDENPPKEPKGLYFPCWDPRTVKKVIFNDPATIVFWSDGSKTVVKCSENDIYDPEKGLAMAFAKKMFGNDNSFHKLFTKWLPKEESEIFEIKLNGDASKAREGIENLQQRIYRALGMIGGKKC